MKEKIKDIFDKINALIENECSNKDFQYFRFKNADFPIRKRKALFNLFPLGSPTEYDIDIFERFIVESKQQASNYNQPKLVIGENMYSKSIILYYYETEQEVFERLSKEYNNLLELIKRDKDEEYKKYLELKLKYEI